MFNYKFKSIRIDLKIQVSIFLFEKVINHLKKIELLVSET